MFSLPDGPQIINNNGWLGVWSRGCPLTEIAHEQKPDWPGEQEEENNARD